MKILLITDTYGWATYGTKSSLYQALAAKVEVDLRLVSRLLPGVCGIRSAGHTHVFYASTGCCPPAGETAVKVGFGFSDPLQMDTTRTYWSRFDHYFSLSASIIEEAGKLNIDAHPFLPAVSVNCYSPLLQNPYSTRYTAVMLGKIEGHPAGPERLALVERLQNAGLSVTAPHTLIGPALFERVTKARCGLNVTTSTGLISRTIFEYAACGLCIVSNRDPRVDAVFEPGTEYLPTDDPGLIEKLQDIDYCAGIASAGRARLLRDHTMEKRVDYILNVLGGKLCE